MRLQRYLDRLHNSLTSRKELVVEQLHMEIIIPEQAAVIAGRIRYWNDSLLEFTETLSMRNMVLAKTRYAYHYQNHNALLLFRYDNAPHHPEVNTYPHHKHVANLTNQTETIEPTVAPDLNDVLREIDQILYPDSNQ